MRIVENAEYIALRLVRKFLLSEHAVRRLSSFLPYYEPSLGESVPEEVVSLYEKHLTAAGLSFRGLSVLEIGAGHANGTAYELAARDALAVWGLEPTAELDARLDRSLLSKACERHGLTESALGSKVRRLDSIRAIASESIDVALSHSVLEHVRDPRDLFVELRRVLKLDGFMLHIVDYRDHFFKYPYHFLQFSRKHWGRWLDPGDLPRWRLSDHLRLLSSEGFVVEVLERASDEEAFERIRPYLSTDFNPKDESLKVTSAVLLARRPVRHAD